MPGLKAGGLMARAARVGDAAAARAQERVAVRVREVVPEALVEVGADGVRVAGRGVVARLRWIGGLLR